MASIAQGAVSQAAEVVRIVGRQGIRSHYQPIVEIESGDPVAYEALARGPAGSAIERPDLLFAAAERAGCRLELEWECRRAAFAGALEAPLSPREALFVNLEPALLGKELPRWLSALEREATEELEIFVELTERALTANPTMLLSAVDALRRAGYRVALDDVGVDPDSVALIPFVAPDVIKLDLSIVQRPPSSAIAEVVHAVNAEAERTGTLVVAEGVETEAHRQRALAMGATHAQGWHFGRPGALGDERPRPGRYLRVGNREARRSDLTPFEVVSEERTTRTGNKHLLLALSRQIEAHAKTQGGSAVVLASFQEARHFTPTSASRYRALAENAALVGAIGAGLSSAPAPLVRGGDITDNALLRREWNVTVTAPHFAVAFVARELDNGPDVADMDRKFEFVITYERNLAVKAARALMLRIDALSAP